ncbi:MAG: cell cycle protein [Frankiales bacterium]|nr:cell cycle protein [Frankiales bacterium]
MRAAGLLPAGNRRGTELALLGFALAISLAAYTSVGLAVDGQVPAGVAGYGAGLAVLFLVAHLGVRLLAPHADPLIIPCVALLNGLGLVLIRRIDLEQAEKVRQGTKRFASTDAPLQLVWTAVGILAFCAILALLRDHTLLSRYAYTCAIVGIGLLLLPMLPGVGREINGARLWIRVGPMTVQPSEIAKILLLVFYASYLDTKRDVLSLASRRVAGLYLPRPRDLGPILLAWAASLAVLVFQNDLGSSLIFFAIFLVVLYVATERLSWLLIGLVMFLAGAYFAYLTQNHVQTRVDIWLHPFADANDKGFQLVQSLFGFGTGGLTGVGLGQGSPDTVPYAKTDFILAAVGEELGLIGVMAVLLVFAVIVERGLRTALLCRDSFGKLVAVGLSFGLALQVFVIVGGVMGLIPLTGVTLPWLSYGGSSVVSSWILVAVLMRVSDAARRPPVTPVNPVVAREALEEAHTQVVRRS